MITHYDMYTGEMIDDGTAQDDDAMRTMDHPTPRLLRVDEATAIEAPACDAPAAVVMLPLNTWFED